MLTSAAALGVVSQISVKCEVRLVGFLLAKLATFSWVPFIGKLFQSSITYLTPC